MGFSTADCKQARAIVLSVWMLHLHPRLLSALILLASLVVSSRFSPAQDTERSSHHSDFQPLVMLTEFNPWAMVVGSDSPTFVLYENGTAIYLKEGRYVSSKLAQAEVEAFVSRFGRDALARLKDSYSISEATDQPTNVLVVRADETNYKKISVYGNIQSLKAKSGGALPLPDELSRALGQVLKYDNANSSAWMPDFIEVMIWPFEYAKGKVADWPTKWPGITDPKTVKHKSTYSIFIAESQYKELKKFIAQLKPTEAVRIDNKKWALSIRFPFPHELQ
ncbi:MAG: hypothetical protein E6L07_13900 [Verrucomicrobia bacterium]|nr:MAG: hypothetical protein E6L07_13900 [Verrucomicrobiota bacterium]